MLIRDRSSCIYEIAACRLSLNILRREIRKGKIDCSYAEMKLTNLVREVKRLRKIFDEAKKELVASHSNPVQQTK